MVGLLAATSVNRVVLSTKMVIAKRGSTSFAGVRDRTPLPRFSFEDFKFTVYGISTMIGASVRELHESDAGRNFHLATIHENDSPTNVLGHVIHPYLAFALPMQLDSWSFQFNDHLRATEKLSRIFPKIEVLSKQLLETPIAEIDLSELAPSEMNQIKYWKPISYGQLLFNRWD